MPENLSEFASALAGFSEPIIDRACTNIEHTNPEAHHPTFPALGILLDECRAAAQVIRDESHTWSLDRYKDCKMFDDYVKDQELHYHRDAQEICNLYPARAHAWIAWKNQLAVGTLICPQWCEVCQGQRYLVSVDANGDRWARRCPHCRSGNA